MTVTGTLPDEVRELADGRNIAHVATLLADGSPHSVPLWIGLEGDQIAFLTSASSLKARNLARDPRIAISLIDLENPTRMATMRGRVVRVVDGDEGWAIIDRISHKYIGAPYPLRSDRQAYLVAVQRAMAATFG
jgi:PPOX class probable F420-dependent enzyme